MTQTDEILSKFIAATNPEIDKDFGMEIIHEIGELIDSDQDDQCPVYKEFAKIIIPGSGQWYSPFFLFTHQKISDSSLSKNQISFNDLSYFKTYKPSLYKIFLFCSWIKTDEKKLEYLEYAKKYFEGKNREFVYAIENKYSEIKIENNNELSRTQNELESIEKEIFYIVTGSSIRDYSTALGVRISKCSLTELMQWRDRLKMEIASGDSAFQKNEKQTSWKPLKSRHGQLGQTWTGIKKQKKVKNKLKNRNRVKKSDSVITPFTFYSDKSFFNENDDCTDTGKQRILRCFSAGNYSNCSRFSFLKSQEYTDFFYSNTIKRPRLRNHHFLKLGTNQ